MTRTILIADDDADIRDILRIALKQADFAVIEAEDGAQALELAQTAKPDLVILDIGMPEMDGLDVCRQLRKSSDVPVLFLTARSDEIDRIVGLELGADDYVAKPFSPRELVARVKVILKRTATAPTKPSGLKRGVLTVDPERHVCHVRETEVDLTAREQDILMHLIARPEHVVPRPALVDQVYGTNIHVSDRTLDSHLRNLRKKLADAGCPDAIDTVHGVGLRMGQCRGQ
ncbi:response regulator transcription factor [Marivivens aquimaris]|uniref:response regulator transcription factor n=1 Tax=Marivivens aquimaris TaxID=2774876 RepID=UPI001880DCA7|nr:response regulator transcription factor [Marivivens aquimaris]